MFHPLVTCTEMPYRATPLSKANSPTPSPDTHPACLLMGEAGAERDLARHQTLERLGLLSGATPPILEEATQTVSRLLAAPICLLSIVNETHQVFKSAVGLSSLGLMNQLAAARELPRTESLDTHVVESGQPLMLADVPQHPAFARSVLVQQYGVQSYAGVPLIASDGCCIGTLSVMDIMPRQFTTQEIAILELNARWCMSEYERYHLVDQGSLPTTGAQPQASATLENQLQLKVNEVRLGLISQLTQDLRNPLTAITGMANMLSREIYGTLTDKQQEYASIIVNSTQNLLSLVDEIIELGGLQDDCQQLSLSPVDIEMLGQQSLQAVEKAAQQQELSLSLSVEPGSRIWVLDKRVIKQMLYHLIFSIIKMSTAGSTVRLHISRKEGRLTLAIWVSNPWLGEDLPQAVLKWGQQEFLESAAALVTLGEPEATEPLQPVDATDDLLGVLDEAKQLSVSRQELGLLLSRHLTKIHEGTVAIQGSVETGYRYVISLPSFES
ncbi:MAG: GAF domain-containing sensor histidine kinase [Cyanobacteria bacterium P01_A01_bin.105]